MQKPDRQGGPNRKTKLRRNQMKTQIFQSLCVVAISLGGLSAVAFARSRTVAALTRPNVANCDPIAGKFVRTEKRFAETVVRFDRTSAKRVLMCASFARIVVKELRNRSYAPIAARLEVTCARCAATGMRSAKTSATYAETFVIFGMTGATRAEIKA